MNPLLNEIYEAQMRIMRNNDNADKRIVYVRNLAMKLSERALKNDASLKIMEEALAKMCLNEMRKIINTPNSKL